LIKKVDTVAIVPPGDGPTDGGNQLWRYNHPFGSVPTGGGVQHAATTFTIAGATTTYDPTFGSTYAGTWPNYLAANLTQYFIPESSTVFGWKAVAQINANPAWLVRWQPSKNYTPDGALIEWNTIP
jgi:hypothetical protein